MIIYGALLISVITAFILYRYFNKETVWWEYILPVVITLASTFGAKAITEAAQVSSTEYWGSFIAEAKYYEPWDEYIQQTCYSTCCCDSKGQNCQSIAYDCSYVKNHPAHWVAITTTGEEIEIAEAQYLGMVAQFANKTFVELNRNYHSIDGDEYLTIWPKDSATAIQVTTEHTYENRVKVADQSVFHFQEVPESVIKQYNLKAYPAIEYQYQMHSVLGINAPLADLKFQYINGLLGRSKQIKVFVLVFPNQPINAALYQESLWSGGNKNEFVICIGTDSATGKVKWCKPFSWCTNQLAMVDVKNYVQAQDKLDLIALAGYCQVELEKTFERKHFKEFSYLTVEPPTWAVLLTYFITLGLNFLLGWWAVRNDFE